MKFLFLNKLILLILFGLILIISSCTNGNSHEENTKLDRSITSTGYETISNDSINNNNVTAEQQKLDESKQSNSSSQNPIDTFSYNVLIGLKPETIIEINRKYQNDTIHDIFTEDELVEVETLIIKLIKLDRRKSALHNSISASNYDIPWIGDSISRVYSLYNSCAIELISNPNSYYYNFNNIKEAFRSFTIVSSNDKRIKTYSWLREHIGREIAAASYYSYCQIGDSNNNLLNTYKTTPPPLLYFEANEGNLYTRKITEINSNTHKLYMFYNKFYIGNGIALCIEVFKLHNDSLHRIPCFPLKSQDAIFEKKSKYFLLLKLMLRQRGVIGVTGIDNKFNLSYNDETKVLQHVEIRKYDNYDYIKGKDTIKYKLINNGFIRIRD